MNQGNIDTLNDLFKEYRVEFQMIVLMFCQKKIALKFQNDNP